MDLATSHLGTDLDGLASLLAVSLLEGPLEVGLPGSMDAVTTRFYRDRGEALLPLVPEPILRERLASGPLGRLLVVDTARAERLGFIGEAIPRFTEVCAFDTHGPEEGDLPRRALTPAAATVAPLVLALAAAGHVPTAEQAGLFLLGVHADTGHFTFMGTTQVDHEAAAVCLSWGAPMAWVDRYVPRGLDRDRLRYIEQMAARAERLTAGGRSLMMLSLDLDEYVPDLAPLLDELRRAEGWETAVLVAADPRRTSFIGRSTGAIDVAAVLRELGGGGHPEAAAAAIRACPLPEARALLVEAMTRAVAQPRAGDLASTALYELPADATVQDAADALHRFRVNALPLTERGAYVGAVSRREVDEALRHGLADTPVSAISGGPPPWVPEDATLDTLRETLLANQGRLALVGSPETGARGVITRSDVFRSALLDPPLAGLRRAPPRARMNAALERAIPEADRALLAAVARVAEARDERVFLVGGAVRDVLLQRTVEDLDLVVLGDGPALARDVVAAHGGRVHAHEAFGTATWLSSDERRVDLTTARTESYRAPAALPSVERGGLRHDLYRRDFTVNAMALELTPSQAGGLVDPFGGQLDLRDGTLRVLHGLSFHDDPTRAWRAARFAGRFDFDLAPGTRALLREALRSGVMERLGPERLGAELHKLLGEVQVARCVAFLRDWGLLAPIHPALPGDRDLLARVARYREAWARYQALAEDRGLSPGEPQWIALGRGVPLDGRRDRRRLTGGVRGRTSRWIAGPDRVRGALRELARAARPAERAAALRRLEPSELVGVLADGDAAAGDAVAWWVREGRHVTPAVSGGDLIARGATPGPGFAAALARAAEVAYDGGDAAAQLAAALSAI